MTTVLNVMFLCPKKRVVVRSVHGPMTRAQFDNWRGQLQVPRAVDCAACEDVHRMIAKDYFLEGDPPPA